MGELTRMGRQSVPVFLGQVSDGLELFFAVAEVVAVCGVRCKREDLGGYAHEPDARDGEVA